MAYVRTAHRPKSGEVFYRATWHIVGPDGKRRQQTKSFAKRSEAKSFAARMEIEIEGKGIGDPEKHDLALYLKRWLAALRQSGDFSPSTLVGYTHHIRRISREIGHIPLARLSGADLDGCYAKLLESGLSRTTVRHCHVLLHTSLERARKWKLVPTNVARDATPPKASKAPVRALTPEEAGRIFAATENRHSYAPPGLDCIVHLLFEAGLRRGELLGLAWDMVDLDAGTITIARTVVIGEDRVPVLRAAAKTPSSLRTIAITPDMVERLRLHKLLIMEQRMKWDREYATGLPPLCFPAIGGGIMPPNNLSIRLLKLFRRIGIKGVQPLHVFRHSHGTWLMSTGMNPKAVSKRMGHSNVAFTLNVYTHPDAAEDRSVADTIGRLLSVVSAAKVPQDFQEAPETMKKRE